MINAVPRFWPTAGHTWSAVVASSSKRGSVVAVSREGWPCSEAGDGGWSGDRLQEEQRRDGSGSAQEGSRRAGCYSQGRPSLAVTLHHYVTPLSLSLLMCEMGWQ